MPVPHNSREPLVSQLRRAETLLNGAVTRAVSSGLYQVRMEVDNRQNTPQVRMEVMTK